MTRLTRLRRRSRPWPAAETPDEADLLRRLRAGEEAAFEELVARYHAAMVRVAGLYVRDRAVVEEVVQETWLAALTGLERFQERSSLKTWLFRILANRARTRAVREGRSVPFSALAAAEVEADDPAVDPDRFFDAEAERLPRQWSAPPGGWHRLPLDRLIARETVGQVAAAIDALPPAQREVIRLRDIEGWRPQEVSAALEITDGNQRVLLHRARSKVRRALEEYLEPDES
jgi:RNA polymerase sigma-70 factor (ECF subfamily)